MAESRVFKKGASKIAYTISLGSYDATNEFAHASGAVPKGIRQFHLDGYYDWGHATYGFFAGEPAYDDIRKRVVAIVEQDPDGEPPEDQE